MKRAITVAALAALSCWGAWAQPAAETPAFEVASVKPSPPPDPNTGYVVSKRSGGPGTQDPTRAEYRNYSLEGLVERAYDLSPRQISGPDWMKLENFDIDAKVPPGTTVQQFRLMLQNLLAARFKLSVHRDTKEGSLYSLTVARSGLKLKPHAEAPPPEGGSVPDDPGRPKFDSRGYPVLPPGIGFGMINGMGRLRLANADLAQLVTRLAAQLGEPVKDDTGLEGKYDIALFWSERPPGAEMDADAGPDLVAALQEQLGLKLERKKGPVEILVIDHAEKVPTGN
jgi:uncharacterized protein (TIGR03435 family)